MAHEITVYSEPCAKCRGQKEIPNPKWAEFVAALSPEQLASGVSSQGVQQKIPCDHCRGMGVKMSDGFWELRDLFKQADTLNGEQVR